MVHARRCICDGDQAPLVVDLNDTLFAPAELLHRPVLADDVLSFILKVRFRGYDDHVIFKETAISDVEVFGGVASIGVTLVLIFALGTFVEGVGGKRNVQIRRRNPAPVAMDLCSHRHKNERMSLENGRSGPCNARYATQRTLHFGPGVGGGRSGVPAQYRYPNAFAESKWPLSLSHLRSPQQR